MKTGFLIIAMILGTVSVQAAQVSGKVQKVGVLSDVVVVEVSNVQYAICNDLAQPLQSAVLSLVLNAQNKDASIKITTKPMSGTLMDLECITTAIQN